MSAASDSSSLASLQVELETLRAEVKSLHAERVEKAAHQVLHERYQQSQVRFRTVFENSPLGHKIIDANLRIRQANWALAQMLGLGSPHELEGRRILEFAHPQHYADGNELQQRLWTHQLPHFSLETRLVRPDGTSFWCQVTSVVFHDEARQLGYTTLEDISAREQAEEIGRAHV